MAEIQVWDIAPSMSDSEENHKKAMITLLLFVITLLYSYFKQRKTKITKLFLIIT
jgi:hypothetical protein